MKVWITKYALSEGLQEVNVVQDDSQTDGMVLIDGKDGFRQWLHGSQWCREHEDAVDRAESMRLAKIASLEKQIAKLQKLRFT